jgi:hypothetical protein
VYCRWAGYMDGDEIKSVFLTLKSVVSIGGKWNCSAKFLFGLQSREVNLN